MFIPQSTVAPIAARTLSNQNTSWLLACLLASCHLAAASDEQAATMEQVEARAVFDLWRSLFQIYMYFQISRHAFY